MSSLSLAPVFSDGMVLQREKEIIIWGYGDEGALVEVEMLSKHASCRVHNGRWRCKLPPQPASNGFEVLMHSGDQSIRLKNVMLGDVFLAAGQSNMEFFMQYEKHWKELENSDKNPNIRMYNCPRIAFSGQIKAQDECGYWFSDENESLSKFSSIGYWFARYLQPTLDVPVGIIACNWGGTSASAWVPEEDLLSPPLNVYLEDYFSAVSGNEAGSIEEKSLEGWAFLEKPEHKAEVSRIMLGMTLQEQARHMEQYKNAPTVLMGPLHKNRPSALYEHMFLSIAPFTFKGVIWYQGENDDHHPEMYSELFGKLMMRWRTDLEDDSLPFLCAQLAPFEKWMALDGKRFPLVRRQQELASKIYAGCYLTTTMDIGEKYDIHPKEKKEIARRFCLLAMDKLYGCSSPGEPPEAVSADVIGNGKIAVHFDKCGSGLQIGGDIDSLFSVIQGNVKKKVLSILLYDEKILVINCEPFDEMPVSIEFAQQPFACVKLYNSAGIPAKPFRITL